MNKYIVSGTKISISDYASQGNAVLELCDCLFLHRQKGKNSLMSLSKWLDFAGAGIGGQVTKSLPLLGKGECWVWSAGSDEPVKISVPQKRTFHPDRRAVSSDKAKSIQETDVSAFVDVMRETLSAYIEEAKKSDPVELKKRVKELETLLGNTKPEVVRQSVPALNDGDIENLKSVILDYGAIVEQIGDKIESINMVINLLNENKEDLLRGLDVVVAGVESVAGGRKSIQGNGISRQRHIGKIESEKGSRVPNMVVVDDFYVRRSAGSLPEGEQKVLVACRQFEQGLTRKAISVMTGYKRSTRDAYIRRLSTKGFVVAEKDNISITQLGVDVLGSSFKTLPAGSALRDYWLNKLPDGERAILGVLIDRYPANLDVDYITSETGYKRSTRDAYIRRMVSKNIVVLGGGFVRASDELFYA